MTVANFTDSYDRDGYCFPVDVLDGNEIEGILAAISSAKEACRGDETKRNAINQYPQLLLLQVHDLTKNRLVIDAVKRILAEDLLVWGVSLFIKETQDALPRKSSNIATRTCGQSGKCFSRASMKARAKGTD